jgi:hypothetical protein
MTSLERRYRALLRVLPRWYRVDREEEMIGTFLAGRDDEFDLQHGWPGWSETWAVVGLALRTRLAARAAPPHAIALGDTVRLVALLGLLAQAALGIASALSAAGLALLKQEDLAASAVDGFIVPTGIALATTVAFVMLVSGRRAAAKACAAVTLALSLVALGTAIRIGVDLPWRIAAVNLPLWIPIACLFAGFHREAPTPTARPWLRAAALGCGVTIAWVALLRLIPPERWAFGTPGDLGSLPAWATVIGGVVYLAALRGAGDGTGEARTGALALALAAYALLILPDRLNFLDFAAQLRDAGEAGDVAFAVTAVQLAGVIGIGIALAIVGLRAVRRSSPSPSPTRAG